MFEIRANVLRPVSEFIRLDLPTLDLPANATSFNSLNGIVSMDVAPTKKVHSWANKIRPSSMAGYSFSLKLLELAGLTMMAVFYYAGFWGHVIFVGLSVETRIISILRFFTFILRAGLFTFILRAGLFSFFLRAGRRFSATNRHAGATHNNVLL